MPSVRLSRFFSLLLLAACSDKGLTEPDELDPPSCTRVAGTAAVSFSLDRGETIISTAQRLSGVKYTRGLVALTSARLLAAHAKTVLLSEDAGCTWTQIGTLPLEYTPVVAASETHAYAWPDSRSGLYRIDINGGVSVLTPPGAAVRGVSVRRLPAEVLRLADERGSTHDSNDGGSTWRAVGTAVPVSSTVYTVAFDPANFNRAYAGTSNTGIWYTTDASWIFPVGDIRSGITATRT